MAKLYHGMTLDSLADHFGNRAKGERARIGRPGQRKKDDEACRVRAAVYEEVAAMLRDTELAK